MELLADTLKKIPLFEGLSDEIISELSEKLEKHELQKNDILFHKGDPGDALYIVEQGRLKVIAKNIHGEEVVLNQFGAGESFGEMSLVDEQPRSATAVALTPIKLLRLNRDDFLAVMAQDSSFALDIIRDLSAKLRFAGTYIQRAMEWSQYIAEGDYRYALREIEEAQSLVEESEQSDEDRARSFLAAIFKMIEGVKKREEALQLQVQRLRIKIDENRRASDVAEITETEYFQSLQQRAKELRGKAKNTDD